MDGFRDGLDDAWVTVAALVPKLIGFILILLIGFFVARLLANLADKALERVGFDRLVQRSGVGRVLGRANYDASSILGKIVFYVVILFVLQMAFGLFGPNPISGLLTAVIAYLPKVFVALVIVVVGAAIAAAVKEIVEASLGGLDYGRGLAIGASVAILVITAFAALDQLEIAPAVVMGLFYAMLAIVVGTTIVAFGGGGIPVARRYLERWTARLDGQTDAVKDEMEGAGDRVKERIAARKEQASGLTSTGAPSSGRSGSSQGGSRPTSGATSGRPWSRNLRTPETKESLKTSEVLVWLVAAAGVLIAANASETLDAAHAWLLVGALTVGYIMSRGFAKSGVRKSG
jgi:hypothetical protein